MPHISADAPARRGEEVFVTQCIPRHRLNGGSASEIGPDLGQSVAVTDYMTEAGVTRIGARSEVSENLAATANARISSNHTAGF